MSDSTSSQDVTSSSWLPTSIPWVDCFKDEGAMYNVTWQCANLTVPVDYRTSKTNSTTQLGVVRGRPNELQKPIGALFSNRGGPSGAMIMPYVKGGAKNYFKVTNRQYDVMLIDPRGTGWSQHMTCGFTSATYSAFMNATANTFAAAEMTGNSISKGALTENAEIYASTGGTFCNEFENKEYLAHMNTPNVVRDFDLVRNLTGYDTLDYWGFSYGTVIGAMYAHMFPNRVGKMVLDGVCDFPQWTSPTSNILDYSFNSHSEIPRILGDFANHCVQAAQQDVKYCPLANNSMNAANPGADVLNRMNNVIGNLTMRSYKDTKSNSTISMMSIAGIIRSGLMETDYFPSLAQYFLDAETLIHNNQPTNNVDESQLVPDPTDPGTDANITTSGWNDKDPLTGGSNSFVFPAVTCLDMSMNGINSTELFVDYVSNQMQNNTLVAYEGVSFASCLSWPNLSSFDVERITSPFPARLKNKILVIGVTDDPVTPYHSAQETYQAIGSDNANFLVHEGFGHCSVADPNNCTWNALINYFVNGSLPANGTSCITNNNGTDNLFVQHYSAPSTGSGSGSGSDNTALKLGLGIGLGVGIPLLIALVVLAWFLVRRSNRSRQGSHNSGPAMSETKDAPSIAASGPSTAAHAT